MPTGARERVEANLAALRVLRELGTNKQASPEQQSVLARWSSWGAVPQLFDRPEWESLRNELRELVDTAAYNAARRTTINAHYTDRRIVESMWHTLDRLGVPVQGTVLEPGCGAGNFLQAAPVQTHLLGVELDPTTAAIARQLTPDARILTESFADTTEQQLRGPVDAVIGNVPFSDVALHDPAHNSANLAMHNHFIVKSLDFTKPGGIVAVLTSRYTLDSINPLARELIGDRAELLAAIRLPNNAHQRTAGTDAITDLLVLRRRSEPAPPSREPWQREAARLALGEAQVSVNRGFLDGDPRFSVLGELEAVSSQYGPTLGVRASTDMDAVFAELRTRLDQIPAVSRPASQPSAQDAPAPALDVHAAPAPAVADYVPRFPGELSITEASEFVEATAALTWQPASLSLARKHHPELRALIDLKHRHRAILELEAASIEDSDELAATRAGLRQALESYHATYGPLNRFTETSTGRVDPDGDPVVSRRKPPAVRAFATDPASVYVLALENFDQVTQAATPASICSQRVLTARTPVASADTPADAIAVCMDIQGRLDLDTLAELLDVPPTEVPTTLGDLAYADPSTDQLVPAAEYLSGPVRHKLAAAREAAALDERWQRNVDALIPIVPADLGPAEIKARLGAVWIPASDIQNFARETLHDSTSIALDPITRGWKITGGSKATVWATNEWGTTRMCAHDLLKHALSQTPVRVFDDRGDGEPPVFNLAATEAARDKLRALHDRFSEWVWEDPERSNRLARAYNERFNSVVIRENFRYGPMALPGLADQFRPRDHQLNAVARVISEGSTGIFHPVGFGKTAVMVMAAMEQKRLGLVTKPCLVVPNHMLEQFSREFVQMYPRAQILAAGSDDLTKDKRRAFVAQAANGNWDAIIMTRSAFGQLPVSPAGLRAYMDQEVAPLRRWLDQNGETASSSQTKRAEKALLQYEEKLKKRLDSHKDVGITFEETGIDYLIVDELHDYKNLMTPSKIEGAAITPGSQRATDLHMKLHQLRTKHGRRAILGATATPISNSVSEVHVMMRYLAPGVLDRAGIEAFDAWAASFGETVTKVELAPDGTSFREKTRFARFCNVPELLLAWAETGDALPAANSDIARPEFRINAEGKREPEIVTVPASDELQAFVAELGERAEKISRRGVEPHEDNMLLVTHEGRSAALDLRLVPKYADTTPDLEVPTKVQAAAAKIATIWQDHSNNQYRVPGTELPHPTPGALQLVFCDLGVPNKDSKFSVYDDLRAELVRRGVPADQIAFAQSAQNDLAKARLFEAARTGQVQVLIGSTQTMGVGTNVQARCIALHHLDCTWKPSEMEQRDGRIWRQGNQNPEIGIYRYATQGSFDGYMYQTVARKARFIDQVMNGDITQREVEDIATDSTLSYEEMQVAIADNPLLAEATQTRAEIQRLQRLKAAHDRAQDHLGGQIRGHQDAIERLTRMIPAYEETITRIQPTKGDLFQAQIGGHTYTSRVDAAVALGQLLERTRYGRGELGTIGGVPWDVQALPQDYTRRAYNLIALDPIRPVNITADEAREGASLGWITRIERALEKAPGALANAKANRDERIREMESAKARVGQAFPHQAELDKLRCHYADLEKRMATEAHKKVEQPTQLPVQSTVEAEAAAATLAALPAPSLTQPQQQHNSAPAPAAARLLTHIKSQGKRP